jgi:hypothetical protein
MASTLKVNEIQHTGGTAALTVDSSGVVLRERIPYWNAQVPQQTGFAAIGVWTKLPYVKDAYGGMSENGTTGEGNTGFVNATNRYVAPVAGLYFAKFNIRLDAVSTGYVISSIYKNGTGVPQFREITGELSTNYETVCSSGIFEMAVGDYLEAYININGDNNVNLDGDNSFIGYLIG